MTDPRQQPPPESRPTSEEIAVSPAVSPAVGPLPPVYVPRSPADSAADGAHWRAAARAARRVGTWATRLAATGRVKDGGAVMDCRLEVVTVPVSDVDRALAFYTRQVGFVLDVDYHPASTFRVVQLTPPGSACSLQIGVGLTDAAPGSMRACYLVVADIEAARRELTGRGVQVSRIRHKAPIDDWQGGMDDGTDPQRRDYASMAVFADPDGDSWVIQEIGHRSSGAGPGVEPPMRAERTT